MKNLANNLKHLRNLKGLSQEYLSEEISISRSQLMSYESARIEPSIDTLIKLSDYFKLPLDILIKNNLTLSKETSFIDVGNQRVLFPIMVDGSDEDLIEVIPLEASAGYLNGYSDPEYVEDLNKIKLPFLPTGKHRAFPIKGDSMLPTKSGSYVIAKFIDDIQDVKDGRTYIILTENDGLVYKRVYDKIEEKNSLLLVSDNKFYPAFEVPKENVLEIWEYTCSINTQEYDEHELKISSIAQMLNQLGIELKALEKLIA
ncbi:helix-turn-helix protein [Lutibacter sp. Hel_I_33_5]|uniref:XRE family transcriptional regulator n=1 Tax=Lutibacter sp. Hel_I_33_5 TaxID=1566289 RepID=UPI0011A0B6D1|nr:helix-turn-helix domain-containing protein [Lutibacter sp. Hel_I_33_5]TVZ56929.1 helix-turn-helix protein [Lutibacter sp. Hel_I_33_5]